MLDKSSDKLCQKCRKQANISFNYQGNYCKNCFIHIFEKRARKELKQLNTKQIILLDDGSIETEVIFSILKQIKGLNITKDSKKGIRATSADILTATFLEQLFTGQYIGKQDILLNSVSQEEILMYAAIKGIKGKIQHHPLLDAVKQLEQKYPGSTFSTAKSIHELQEL
ncbi:hypothetical protein HYV79_04215 [Candidatus Woesearchaeota archaeon]|nr:hypothetical protein [Candidatus Woesearchaeota archaeon]